VRFLIVVKPKEREKHAKCPEQITCAEIFIMENLPCATNRSDFKGGEIAGPLPIVPLASRYYQRQHENASAVYDGSVGSFFLLDWYDCR
jgi:hypothetical protein